MMTSASPEVGHWFRFPENQIVRSVRQTTRRFSTKSGTRPVIVAVKGRQFVSIIFPRSTNEENKRHNTSAPNSSRNHRFRSFEHEEHSHRRFYPDCCIDLDGWVVDFQVTAPNSELMRHGPKCKEPDNTGLMEQLTRWLSI